MGISRIANFLSGRPIAAYAPGGTTTEDPVLKVLSVGQDGSFGDPEPDGSVPTGSPFSATAAGVLFTIDTLGYDSLSVVFSNFGTGNNVFFYQSNDGINWTSKEFDRDDQNLTAGFNIQGASSVVFPCTARYIRATVTTYATGTITAQTLLRSSPAPVRSMFLNGGSVGISNGLIIIKNTSGGLSQAPFRTTTAATQNGLVVKASAGQVYGYTFANTSTGWRYIHFYTQTTGPTAGATDVRVVPIPPGGVVMYSAADIGIAFSTGIAVAITTSPAQLLAAGDITAIAVNDVTGMIDYA